MNDINDKADPAATDTHHAAIVSGILPDGEILYTQHSGSAIDYPMNG